MTCKILKFRIKGYPNRKAFSMAYEAVNIVKSVLGEDQSEKPVAESETYPPELERCVKSLISKGKAEKNAWAICTAALQKSGVIPKGEKNESSFSEIFIEDDKGNLVLVKRPVMRGGVEHMQGFWVKVKEGKKYPGMIPAHKAKEIEMKLKQKAPEVKKEIPKSIAPIKEPVIGVHLKRDLKTKQTYIEDMIKVIRDLKLGEIIRNKIIGAGSAPADIFLPEHKIAFILKSNKISNEALSMFQRSAAKRGIIPVVIGRRSVETEESIKSTIAGVIFKPTSEEMKRMEDLRDTLKESADDKKKAEISGKASSLLESFHNRIKEIEKITKLKATPEQLHQFRIPSVIGEKKKEEPRPAGPTRQTSLKEFFELAAQCMIPESEIFEVQKTVYGVTAAVFGFKY